VTGAAEGAVEVAHRRAQRVFLLEFLLARRLDRRFRQVEAARLAHVAYPHQRGRGACLLEGLGHDQRHRLVVMVDLGPRQGLGDVEAADVQPAGVLRGHDADHAGRRARRLQVDRFDTALGDAGADHIAVGGVRRLGVLFVGIGGAAGGLQRPVDAFGRFADHAQAVDRVGACRGVEFHRRS